MKKFFIKTVAALALCIASVDSNVEAMQEVGFSQLGAIPAAPCFFPWGRPDLSDKAVAFRETGENANTKARIVNAELRRGGENANLDEVIREAAGVEEFYFTVQTAPSAAIGDVHLFHPHAAYSAGENWNTPDQAPWHDRGTIRTAIKRDDRATYVYRGRSHAHPNDDGIQVMSPDIYDSDRRLLNYQLFRIIANRRLIQLPHVHDNQEVSSIYAYVVNASDCSDPAPGRGHDRVICGVVVVANADGKISGAIRTKIERLGLRDQLTEAADKLGLTIEQTM